MRVTEAATSARSAGSWPGDYAVLALFAGYARVDAPDELEKVLKRSLGAAPILIEVRVGDLSSPWPYIRLRGGKPSDVPPDLRRQS